MPNTVQILNALKAGVRETAIGFAAGGSMSYVVNYLGVITFLRKK